MGELIKAILLLAALALPVCVGGMVMIGGGDGSWQHERVIVIKSPQSDVFDALTKAGKRRQWFAEESRKIQPGEARMAHTYLEVVLVDGKRRSYTAAVSEFEHDTRFAIEIQDEDLDAILRYQISTGGSIHRTRLKFTCEAQFHHWVKKVFEPMAASSIRARMDEDLEALKEFVERTSF